MGRTDRTAARRIELLALGKRLFAERPFADVSAELIAREGGISAGLVYHYFGDKRGFYLATLESSADELLGVLALPDSGVEAGLAGVPAMLDRFLEFVGRQPALFRGVLRGGTGGDLEAHAVAARVRQEVLCRCFEAAGRSGGIGDATPAERLEAYAWVGGVEAAALRWVDTREVDRATVARLCVRLLPSFFLEVR